MATGYGLCVHIVHEHRAISSSGTRRQFDTKSYGGCADIVRKSCNFRAVVVQYPLPSQGSRTELVRLPHKDCAEMVW